MSLFKKLLGIGKTVGPIIVSSSSSGAITGTLLKQGTAILGSAIATTGVLTGDQSAAAAGIIISLGSALVAALQKKRNHDEKAVLADAAPDSVGVVK